MKHALRIDGSLSIRAFIDGADSNVGMSVGVACVRCGRTGTISTGDDAEPDDAGQSVTAPLEIGEDCAGKWDSPYRGTYEGRVRGFR